MDDNEDEPEDVRKATPVEEEIKKGAVDEDSGQPTKLPETSKKRHHCEAPPKKKLKEKSEGECCRAREAKATKEPKYATVLVYEKKCILPKLKAVPRHCITKKEWIDSLATPSRRCPSPCLQKSVTRRIRPVSARMAELGQPPKQRMINTLQAKAGILPIELVDKLIQRLETETCVTPEQAEKMFRDKDVKKCAKDKKNKAKCGQDRSKILEAGISSSVSPFDKEAVNCQYSMAESFVKSILDWECPIPREEFKDIADVILKRLGFLLEYEPINGEDRKSQQMRFLADVIGSWIAGVLFEVAEVRKTELEEECERRKKATAEESEEESDDDSEDNYPRKYDDDDDDDGKPDGGRKPEDDEQKKDARRPLSRGWGFRSSKDKNSKDDDDKDKTRKSSKKGSEESEKNVRISGKDDDDTDKTRKSSKKGSEESGRDVGKSLDYGKRKSSDVDKFYDARTGGSQEIGEKKTPMKEPKAAGERLKDMTPEKAPESAKIGAEGQKGPEVMKEDDQRRRTDDKLEKIESSKLEASEGRGKGLEAEELPVTSPKATELTRENGIPEKIQREVPQEAQRIDDRDRKQSGVVGTPEAAKTIDGPEAISQGVDRAPEEMVSHSEDSSALGAMKEATPDGEGKPKIEGGLPKTDKVAVEPDKTPPAEKLPPSKEETTKPVIRVPDPEKEPKDSEVTSPRREKSTDDEERKRSEADSIKMDHPSAKLPTPESLTDKPKVTADTKMQLEEKQQVPQASIGEEEMKKAEADAGRMIEQVSHLDRGPQIPEVTADTRATSGEKKGIPKASIGDMKMEEPEAKAEKISVPSAKLDPIADVSETRAGTGMEPEAQQTVADVPQAGREESPRRSEAAKKRPEVSQTVASVPQEIREKSSIKPDVDGKRPQVSQTVGEVPLESRKEPLLRPESMGTRLEVVETRPEVVETRPEVVETRPEVVETRPETMPDAEPKIEEPKKVSKDYTTVVPTRKSWDKTKLAETEEERRRILDPSRRPSDKVDQLKEKFGDSREKKKPKEYPHGVVVDKKFRTDTPFVTFDKIFHTIYNAIENNEENNGNDPVTNRIHRAVYEKCSEIVQEEKPGQLSGLTKDVLEVMSGKIAIWLRNILTESQMNFVDQFPATVESTEVREWTSWISFVSNTADDWSNWIQKTIRQAEGLSNQPITRRDWANWTENVDTDALKWRRFYLESVHQAHQNLTMIRDRQVVKTGTKRFYDHNDENEKEVKITDLENERRTLDRSS